MASTEDSGGDINPNLGTEQDVLLRSLLQTNQKICSLLEVLVNDRAHLDRTEPTAKGLEHQQTGPVLVPTIGRVLLQNDFDLPEFSYPQFLQNSDSDSFCSKPGYLPAENYTHEDLRVHINRPYWSPAVRKLLHPVLSSAPFLDYGFMEDRSFHVSYDHLARLLVCVTLESGKLFRTRSPLAPTQSYSWLECVQECWDDLRTMNRSPKGQGPFVGRVVVLSEPGPLKLAALHLVMSKHFDVDSIFAVLSTQDSTNAYLFPVSDDYYGKRQRNFVFAFKYFTVIDQSRSPCAWQTFDTEQSDAEERIPISSCSSVVALSLLGDPIRYVEKVVSGRVRKYPVYDPFAPWQLLVLNFFPDLHTTPDVFTMRSGIANGPEAFLRAVLAQYCDAQKRFAAITSQIINLTTLGVSFLTPNQPISSLHLHVYSGDDN
jgi:hypothetical protein